MTRPRNWAGEEIRRRVQGCAQVWRNRAEHDDVEVLEALATLLAAYGLGSRTAEAALVTRASAEKDPWVPPPRERALDMAADVMRLADDLRLSRPTVA